MLALGGFWKKFVELLPSTPRQTGEVIQVNGNGRYFVTLVGSGTVEVRSDTHYSVGDKVFVKGDVIEGAAPSLTQTIIEV